jgi:uncharacterized membrane protein YdjX (TVP38/TMEM64 family)
MLPSTRGERVRLVIALCALGIVIVCVSWLALSDHYFQIAWQSLQDIFQGRDQLREYVQSWGSLAPVAFMSIQALQVLIAPIPGELTGVVGGFIFGTWRATIYSTIGLTAGSVMAFLAARVVGQPLLKLVISPDTMSKFDKITHGRGVAAIFFLFLLPGFPKDLLSYFLGFSPMKFGTFVLICAAGRLPGTALLGASGSALFKENWWLIAILSSICVIAFLIAYWKKEELQKWLHHQRTDE